MVDQPERSAASERVGEDIPPTERLPERSASSPVSEYPQKSITAETRPRQIAGKYPQRQMTYYQISTSDLRSIGVAHAATTICIAIGTFALAAYMDFSKDITIAIEGNQPVPQFLYDIAELSYWGWLVFWFIALVAFIWGKSELSRIKEEHGEHTFWSKVKARWKR